MRRPCPCDLAPYVGEGIDLPTFGGRMSVRWEPRARVTSVAGLAHFSTFLAATGLFDRLAEDAPFDYTSNNAYRYIVDIDNTVKPIYGHQEGAELGYNPVKPGRPCHNYHSFTRPSRGQTP